MKVDITWEEIVPASGTIDVPDTATDAEITDICDNAVHAPFRMFARAEFGPTKKILTVQWKTEDGKRYGERARPTVLGVK